MAGVVASLVTNDNVEPLGEQIDNLAFAFIAPLGADDRDYHRSEVRDQRSEVRNQPLDTQEARLCRTTQKPRLGLFVQSGDGGRPDVFIEHARNGLLRCCPYHALFFSAVLEENQSGYTFDP